MPKHFVGREMKPAPTNDGDHFKAYVMFWNKLY